MLDAFSMVFGRCGNRTFLESLEQEKSTFGQYAKNNDSASAEATGEDRELQTVSRDNQTAGQGGRPRCTPRLQEMRRNRAGVRHV